MKGGGFGSTPDVGTNLIEEIMVKVRLLTNILFEYFGVKKTLFKKGSVFEGRPSYKYVLNPLTKQVEETNILDGYWIGNERGPKPLKGEAPGCLIETKCFLYECEIV